MKKDISVFQKGRQATPLPVTRVERPKPVVKHEKYERWTSSGIRKVAPERPQAIQKAAVSKPVE